MGYAANVSAGRTEDFNKATQAVGDYIESLNLPVEANNRLIELILANILEAEKGAFDLGINISAFTAGIAFRKKRSPIEEDFKAALEEYGALEEGVNHDQSDKRKKP